MKQIKILVTGDVYLGGGRVKEPASRGEETLLFGDFLDTVRESDLAITNLESPVTRGGTPIAKTGPALRADIQALSVLRKAGFGLVTLANNHIMDYGADGLDQTIHACQEDGLAYVGAGRSLEEARKPFIVTQNGVKVAIVNIAENEFGTTQGAQPGAHPLDPVSNFNTIKEAAAQVDHVVVIVHGGHELYAYPSPRMKKTYRFFIEAGASAVVGHHPHWYSGYEVYQGAPIFYSLGNFLFDHATERAGNWNKGFAVSLTLGEGNVDYRVIPYTQCGDHVGVQPLIAQATVDFEAHIAALNAIISNDDLLQAEFDAYVRRSRTLYSGYLEPHSFRIVRALQRRGLLPSVLSSYKRRLLLNLVRCEAHRDVVSKILET